MQLAQILDWLRTQLKRYWFVLVALIYASWYLGDSSTAESIRMFVALEGAAMIAAHVGKYVFTDMDFVKEKQGTALGLIFLATHVLAMGVAIGIYFATKQ